MKVQYIVVILFLFMISGCKEYLDVKPRGYDVPTDISQYKGLIFGIDQGYLPVFNLMSFEFTADEDSYSAAYSLLNTKSCNSYKWSPKIFRDDESSSEWDFIYKQLYTFNLVANGVMGASDGTVDEKKSLRAEARMLRSWYTFMAVQNFSKPYNEATASNDLCVPIVTEALTVGNDFKRATVEEVYSYILNEMNESLPSLTTEKAHPLRVFKSAGNAMLGKVYWMMGRYDDALPYLEVSKTILDNDGVFPLNYNDMIDENGEITNYPQSGYNIESVYLVNAQPKLWLAFYPAFYGSTLFYFKSDVLEEYYSADDLRLALISGINSGVTAYSSFDVTDKFYPNITNMITNYGISLPDIYLMYAECLARKNRLSDASEVLYELRRNRMSDESAAVPSDVSTQDDLIKYTVAERMRENMGSGLTWYDTRRLWNDPLFQDLKTKYTHTDGTQDYILDEQRLTMQIPPSTMLWHATWVNNE